MSYSVVAKVMSRSERMLSNKFVYKEVCQIYHSGKKTAKFPVNFFLLKKKKKRLKVLVLKGNNLIKVLR